MDIEIGKRMKKKIKYLIIGSAATDDPKTHGGVTILVRQLLTYFNEKNKDYIFIQAKKFNVGKLSVLFNYLYIVYKTLININKVDIIMINVTKNTAYYVAPIILVIAKIFNKKFVFRKFAGNCIEVYQAANSWKQKLMDYLVKNADIMFFEPKYLVEYFSKKRKKVFWFPNVRIQPQHIRDLNRKYEKKFVFLGQIRTAKGVDELIEAFKGLSFEYQLDLYGDLYDKKYTEQYFDTYENITYRGYLNNKVVYETLSQYDVLVLPSYMEGYPGVLLEAFAIGLPVIATNLPSIKEMVDDTNGVLIEAKTVKPLIAAVKHFDQENYINYSDAALKRFKAFEYESTYQRIIDICEKDI